jgi:16S rRNA (cytidine1402-2'-O)-methyltransferase
VGFFRKRKESQRQKALNDLAAEKRTMVFYEAPHRILETIGDMNDIFGERGAVVVKEITKLYEEVLRGSLSEITDMLYEKTIAGEYVVLVEGKGMGDASPEEALLEVKSLMKKGRGRKEAVKLVAGQYGLSKKDLYDRSLVDET